MFFEKASQTYRTKCASAIFQWMLQKVVFAVDMFKVTPFKEHKSYLSPNMCFSNGVIQIIKSFVTQWREMVWVFLLEV